MKGIWLSRPHAAEGEYGPVTLPELRRMVAAGLICEATCARDPDTPARPITDWPVLRAALAAPALREWHGEAAHRGLVGGAGVQLRQDSLAFDASNQPGDTRSLSALDVRRVNRAHERDIVVRFPPWYRWPWWRNFARWLWIGLPAGTLLVTMTVKLGPDSFWWNALSTLPLMVVWGFFVWVLQPRTWNGRE